MLNLELHDLEFGCKLPEDTCLGATHVTISDDNIFVIRSKRVSIYDAKDGHNKNFDPNRQLPELKCVTQLTYLQAPSQLWFGTGKQFISIDASTCGLHFVVNAQKKFFAAVWNNAQDKLAVVYKDNIVGVYEVDFSIQSIILLHSANLNAAKPILPAIFYRWSDEDYPLGSRSRRRQIDFIAADEIIEVPKPMQDYGKSTLCWNRNDKYFAVNFFFDEERTIRVYKSDCTLLYAYRESGLQSIMTWGNPDPMITAIVWTNRVHTIVILQQTLTCSSRHRLQHLDTVEEIKWSHGGTQLATLQRNSQGFKAITIYFLSNFKLYSKQTLQFTKENPPISFTYLNCDRYHVLEVITFKEMVKYYFKLSASHNHVANAKNSLAVASINGHSLQLLFCASGVMPLPLNHLDIVTKFASNFVTFHPEKQLLATLDSMNVLTIYKFQNEKYDLIYEYQLPCSDSTNVPLRIKNVYWRSDKQIVFLKNEGSSGKKIHHVYFLNMQGYPSEWTFGRQSRYIADVHNVYQLTNSTIMLLQTATKIAVLDQEIHIITLPSIPLYVDAIILNGRPIVFALSATNMFMVNNVDIHPCISSFIIHDDYLVLVTLAYKLIILKMNGINIEYLMAAKFNLFYTRQIDCGSRLLFGIPGTSSVILENGRGNIEQYNCKLIKIYCVDELIQEDKWLKALEILRQEKVDYNVLIDLDIDRFLNKATAFIQSVHSEGLLCEFLVHLTDDNVFLTTYKDCAIRPAVLSKMKCTLVCNALISAMREYNYIYFVKPIIIAEIMKSESQVHQALKHISYLLDHHTEHESYVDIADTAVQTIQSLKPALKIYNVALSMYNLKLAAFIASRIGLDPREFEPFIWSLHSMDKMRARLVINQHLQTYRNGLMYCILLGDSNEIYNYIQEHNLAYYAYPFLRHNTTLLVRVVRLACSALHKERRFEESAVIYLYANLKMEALAEYVCGVFWKEALALMEELQIDSPLKLEFLSSMVQSLIRRHSILDAAHILESCLNKTEDAIKLLIEHNEFGTAIKVASKRGRVDLIREDIKIAVGEHFHRLCSKFTCMTENFKDYLDRLVRLRKEKQEFYDTSHPNESYGLEFPTTSDHDAHSISATTVYATSTASFRTGRSSTRGPKAQHKKECLTKGSHYEDIALMKILYNMIVEAFLYGPKLRHLLLMSIASKLEFNFIMDSAHKLLLKLQNRMKASLELIWPPELRSIEQNIGMNLHSYVYQNVYELDAKYRSAPPDLNSNWTLSSFTHH